MPLALSDKQLQIVTLAAGGPPPEKRSVFLQRLAAQLAQIRRPGDADVEHAARAALRGTSCRRRRPSEGCHRDPDDLGPSAYSAFGG
jgi:hypothetical protein